MKLFVALAALSLFAAVSAATEEYYSSPEDMVEQSFPIDNDGVPRRAVDREVVEETLDEEAIDAARERLSQDAQLDQVDDENRRQQLAQQKAGWLFGRRRRSRRRRRRINWFAEKRNKVVAWARKKKEQAGKALARKKEKTGKFWHRERANKGRIKERRGKAVAKAKAKLERKTKALARAVKRERAGKHEKHKKYWAKFKREKARKRERHIKFWKEKKVKAKAFLARERVKKTQAKAKRIAAFKAVKGKISSGISKMKSWFSKRKKTQPKPKPPPPPPAPKPPPAPVRMKCGFQSAKFGFVANKFNLPGTPVKSKSLTACVGICRKTKGCVAFSYMKGSAKSDCWLKSSSRPTDAGKKIYKTQKWYTYVVKGCEVPKPVPKCGFQSTKFGFISNKFNLPGTPVKSKSLNKCISICKNNRQCVAFSYMKGSAKSDCWLKSNAKPENAGKKIYKTQKWYTYVVKGCDVPFIKPVRFKPSQRFKRL